jgi:signal transduction histidine kinase
MGTSRSNGRTRHAAGADDSAPTAALVPGETDGAPERVIAATRLAVSLIVFAALLAGLGPLHSPLARLVTAAYVVHACAAAWTAWSPMSGWWCSVPVVHLVDLVFAAAATSVSGGPASHAFPLFLFVLVASAYRWGLQRTLLDGTLVVAIAVAQSAAAAAGWTPWTFELDWFVLWAPFLVAVPALVAVLSDRQRAQNTQAIAIIRVASRVAAAPDLDSAVRRALASVVALSGAREALLAIEEVDTRRAFLVRAARHQAGAEVSRTVLTDVERKAWFATPPPEVSAFETRRPRRWAFFPPTLAIDREGRRMEIQAGPPRALEDDASWTTFACLAVDEIGSWTGRIFLLDPSSQPAGARRLRFLQALARQVGPELVNMYLVGQLRSRAGSQERARVSRELHDGLVQSLLALDMGLDVLQRRAEIDSPVLADQMEEFRHQLHDEALNARDMMQRLRPMEVDRLRLPYELRDLVERFGRSAGIEARLDWAVGALDLSPRECREVVRLVQEALVNVRRHSGASRVRVRLEADAAGWGLVVEDDGRGLGFTGRLTHEEMRHTGQGPRVIRERVEGLHGEVTMESTSGGTRLEMAFPLVRD